VEVTLISVPYDQDQYGEGMGLAPAALLEVGLADRLEAGGVTIKELKTVPEDLGQGERLDRLARLGSAVADMVSEARKDETIPVILGGDCLNALGVSAGLRRALGEREFGVAWFDAHGDFNTEATSLSGYLPGMPLACVCGRALAALRREVGLTRPVVEKHVLMLGVRDLDPPEKRLLESTPVVYLNPGQVRAGETKEAVREQFEGVSGVYLHLDVDAVDPVEMPGVSFPVPGGMTIAEVMAAARTVLDTAPLAALTITAVNPPKDVDGRSVEAAVDLLSEILASVKGI